MMGLNMSSHIITSTEANRHFSDLLNRVRYQGQSFDIKRGKEIVAKLVPAKPMMLASEFNDFLKSLPALDAEDRQGFEKIIEESRAHLHTTRNPWD